MNEDNRKRVDLLKNGVDQIERFTKFKETVSGFSELELFVLIDQLGYIIWRTEHDLADQRIDYPEWDKNDKYVLQAEIELAVDQTVRFGVQPFVPESLTPSPMYFKWIRWWKGYVESMPKEEWDKMSLDLNNKGDLSKYRPQGKWNI